MKSISLSLALAFLLSAPIVHAQNTSGFTIPATLQSPQLTENADGTYSSSCPSGASESDGQCYSCPSGYTLSGSYCQENSSGPNSTAQSGPTSATQSGPNTTPGGTTLLNPLSAGTNLQTLLTDILGFIIQIGVVVVVLMLVYVGFMFATAAGEPAKISRAREALLWTVVGALILLGAQAIASGIQATASALSTGS